MNKYSIFLYDPPSFTPYETIWEEKNGLTKCFSVVGFARWNVRLTVHQYILIMIMTIMRMKPSLAPWKWSISGIVTFKAALWGRCWGWGWQWWKWRWCRRWGWSLWWIGRDYDANPFPSTFNSGSLFSAGRKCIRFKLKAISIQMILKRRESCARISSSSRSAHFCTRSPSSSARGKISV